MNQAVRAARETGLTTLSVIWPPPRCSCNFGDRSNFGVTTPGSDKRWLSDLTPHFPIVPMVEIGAW
jgi:hypothetical protein